MTTVDHDPLEVLDEDDYADIDCHVAITWPTVSVDLNRADLAALQLAMPEVDHVRLETGDHCVYVHVTMVDPLVNTAVPVTAVIYRWTPATSTVDTDSLTLTDLTLRRMTTLCPSMLAQLQRLWTAVIEEK